MRPAPENGSARGRLARPRLVAIQVLPTVVTLGNSIAGILALCYVVDAIGRPDVAGREALFARAAWAIFVGMLCDVLDGRIARLTGAASTFGAELDSLADVVTFGVAPALLAKTIVEGAFPATLSPKLSAAFAAVYALGATLRLARYNVESRRLTEPGHVTLVFRGLPSPGAAGVVASLVLLRSEVHPAWVDHALLAVVPTLGLLMVSRFAYPHVLNRYLGVARSPAMVLVLFVLLVLGVQHPEIAMAVLFCGYGASGPVASLGKAVLGRPRWADDEDADEEDEPGDAAESERDATTRGPAGAPSSGPASPGTAAPDERRRPAP